METVKASTEKRSKSEKTQDVVRNQDKAHCINSDHDGDT